MAGVLAKYVDAFVDGVSADLGELSGRDHTADVVVEASDLVGAVIASDGRLTAAELEAWLDDLGSRLSPPVFVTSERLRESDLLAGKEAWLARPSTLVDLLMGADARDGGRRAARYYDLGIRLAHAAAAVDLVPSPDEIAAIDRFRSVLLGAFDRAGVPRPGQPGQPATPLTPAGPVAATATATDQPAPPPVELPPERPIEELLAELDALVGLDQVKADVRRLTSLLRIQRLREERGLPTLETSHHLVFTGNPGTGKTTVARLLSQILRTLGIVSKGHLVETDRSHLVAGYVGQTATKTRAVLESALGGTLLVDEAYALARGGENDFGLEAVDTLVKFMEDHRSDLAVIAAGYPDEMATLIDANPGLKSRFARTIHFADYTTEQLVAIFERMSSASRYHLDEAGRPAPRRGHPRRAANTRVRQRPLRPQRLRGGRRPPGRSIGRGRVTDRRRAHHADGVRHQPARCRGSRPGHGVSSGRHEFVSRPVLHPADGASNPLVADPARGRPRGGAGGRRTARSSPRAPSAARSTPVSVVAAMPNRTVRASIDPFTLGEPWRQFVQSAQRSRSSADGHRRPGGGRPAARPARRRSPASSTAASPRAGASPSAATRSTVSSAGSTRPDCGRSSERCRQQAAAAPTDNTTAAIESVERQLATADRLKAVSASTADRLRLTQARLDELVARSAEIAAGAGDTTEYAHDVDDLVLELEALRLAVQELPGSTDGATGTAGDTGLAGGSTGA